jgi:hypothetical protein
MYTYANYPFQQLLNIEGAWTIADSWHAGARMHRNPSLLSSVICISPPWL